MVKTNDHDDDEVGHHQAPTTREAATTTTSKLELSGVEFDKLVTEIANRIIQDNLKNNNNDNSNEEDVVQSSLSSSTSNENGGDGKSETNTTANHQDSSDVEATSANNIIRNVDNLELNLRPHQITSDHHQTDINYNHRLNQPKRPMNAFMVWGQAIRRELHVKFSNVQNASLSKCLGRIWRSLEPADKEPFIKKANLIKANHKRDYPNYRYQPRRIQERRSRNNMLIGVNLNHPVNQNQFYHHHHHHSLQTTTNLYSLNDNNFNDTTSNFTHNHQNHLNIVQDKPVCCDSDNATATSTTAASLSTVESIYNKNLELQIRREREAAEMKDASQTLNYQTNYLTFASMKQQTSLDSTVANDLTLNSNEIVGRNNDNYHIGVFGLSNEANPSGTVIQQESIISQAINQQGECSKVSSINTEFTNSSYNHHISHYPYSIHTNQQHNNNTNDNNYLNQQQMIYADHHHQQLLPSSHNLNGYMENAGNKIITTNYYETLPNSGATACQYQKDADTSIQYQEQVFRPYEIHNNHRTDEFNNFD